MSLWPGWARKLLRVIGELQGAEGEEMERGGWRCKPKELREQDCKGIKSHGESRSGSAQGSG